MPKKEIFTEIEGRKLKLSNLNKILFPKLGIIKAELIQYYISIAPYILPHLQNRPLTLIRYPDGIDGNKFYSKNKANWTPEWVECIKLNEEDEITYIMANDLPSLAWIANLAALELHPMLITSDQPNRPDHFIFDLDPPESANFEVVKNLALRLKSFLESYGYQPFIKTSGSKGLHIYTSIAPIYEQSVVLECVKDLARLYIETDPTTTLKMNKEQRQGKVLLDIYRNHLSQTCVAPYSTRGIEGAPVSTPIFWKELEHLESSQTYSIRTIFDKLDSDGDPWSHFKESATKLHIDKSTTDVKSSVSTPKKSVTKGKKASINDIDLNPMLAISAREVPHRSKYSYEIKWDGIRIIVIKEGEKVNILSRNGNDLTDKFPIIHNQFKKQLIDSFIVDGELMVMNAEGSPNFSKIVGRMHQSGTEPIQKTSKKEKATIYLFDALFFDKKDIRNIPLEERRNWLEENFTWNEYIKFSESFDDGAQLLEAIKGRNMEGIMCKLKGSRYESNMRSSAWIKVKVQNEAHALIIGYTKGKGDRSNLFGALHLAKKEKDRYVYYGKVGTGFNEGKMLEIVALLSEVKRIKKPIKEAVEDEKNSIWLEPAYSCELKFASMTSNETYREPVFLNIHKTSELS